MPPRLCFCHVPFQKDLETIRRYRAERGYAGVEWNLENWRVVVAQSRRRDLLRRWRAAAPLASVHLPYTDWEIGHRDREFAAASLRLLREYLDLAADLGAHHANVHVAAFGLGPDELCRETLARNLTALLEHGARRGVPVTVENLRRGLTADPGEFAALLRQTGAPATFDHGHARGSAWVKEGHGSAADVLAAIPTPVLATHLYLIEQDDSHFPPRQVAEMAEALDGLIARGCDYWVLELADRAALEATRGVIDRYLETAAAPAGGGGPELA